MMTPRQKRMLGVALMVAGVAIAAFFALTAFQKNLLYFYTPSQVASGEVPTGYPFRIGGLVVKDSVKREADSLTVRFEVSDGPAAIAVRYTGILPDLFREGQGIIAVGQVDDAGTFQASEVLAKHDENYMPPEVAESLKKNGQLPADYSEYQKK